MESEEITAEEETDESSEGDQETAADGMEECGSVGSGEDTGAGVGVLDEIAKTCGVVLIDGEVFCTRPGGGTGEKLGKLDFIHTRDLLLKGKCSLKGHAPKPGASGADAKPCACILSATSGSGTRITETFEAVILWMKSGLECTREEHLLECDRVRASRRRPRS